MLAREDVARGFPLHQHLILSIILPECHSVVYLNGLLAMFIRRCCVIQYNDLHYVLQNNTMFCQLQNYISLLQVVRTETIVLLTSYNAPSRMHEK